MKKSNWKRVLAIGLALTMAVGLTACGGKGEGGEGGSGGGLFGGGSGSGGNNNPNANNELSKQYVYTYKDVELGQPKGDEYSSNIIASLMSGDEVYLLFNENTYDMVTYTSKNKLCLYTLDKQGNKKGSVELEDPSPVQDEADDDSTEAPKKEVSAETEDVLYPEDYDDYYDQGYHYVNNYYSSSAIANNQIFSLRNYNEESYDPEEGWNSVSETYLDCWDLKGKLLWETGVDMSKFQNDDSWSWVRSIMSLSDGRVALMIDGDQAGMIFVDKDGGMSDIKKSNSNKDYFQREAGEAFRQDGTMILSFYDEEWSKQYLVNYDPVKDEYSQVYDVPSAARGAGFYEFSAGTDYDIVYSTSEGVYAFNLGDTEVVKLMDYINSDLAAYSINDVMIVDSEHFFGMYSDSTDYQQHFSLFTYVKPEDIQDKKTLVFAGVYVDSDVKRDIINFNKTNSQYRITVKDYNIYSTDDDYTAPYTKLNNDIIAGNIPDILAVNDLMPTESYISKGLFADVDELIKKDPELSKIEFMDNVFEAYRVNGKLYSVIPFFSVHTFIGKKSLLGDRKNITMDELNQIANNLSGDGSIFGGSYSRESFIGDLLAFCGSDFVNVETGKCNFDNSLFISLLEYAKNLPTDDSMWGDNYDEDYWNEYYQNYESQYRENRTLLMQSYLYDLTNLKNTINGYFGEDVTFIGFPSENENGSIVSAINSYSLYAKSPNLDGAWEFARIYLTEDYQTNEDNKYGYHWGLPIHKSLIQKMVDETTKKSHWTNYETGEEEEYDDTFYINGQEIVINPLSREQADKLFAFVSGVKKAEYRNEDVRKIIDEEIAAFFSGQKSAQDAASMIQNRVQLYVNENM